MLELIITGGQSGADLAGWQAAKLFNITTTGWMTRRYLTEDGPRPQYKLLYGARPMVTDNYTDRTRANVRDADAVLWFGHPRSPGALATLRECRFADRRYRVVYPDVTPDDISDWIIREQINVLMIAGNRESRAPGIENQVLIFLKAVFAKLAAEGYISPS